MHEVIYDMWLRYWCVVLLHVPLYVSSEEEEEPQRRRKWWKMVAQKGTGRGRLYVCTGVTVLVV